MRVFLLSVVALLAGHAAAPVHAAESTDGCQYTISSLPAVASSPGTWCLSKDLGTSIASGSAITISTNNVTLDCNGYRISGLGAGADTQTNGIGAFTRYNTQVRNCRVRGFMQGIVLTLGGANLVERNQLDGNTSIGINVSGGGSIIRDNVVYDTGGSTASPQRYGITVYGGVDVIDNLVEGVSSTTDDQHVYGIRAACCQAGSTIRGNRIRELDAGPGGRTYGIRAEQQDMFIEGNHILGLGVPESYGVSCMSAEGTSIRNATINTAVDIETCYSVDDVNNPN